MGIKAALYKTKIPKIEVLTNKETNEIEYIISEDPSDYKTLDSSNVPVSITFGKIGDCYLVDPTLEEEKCLDSRITISINQKGNICSIQKGCSGKGFNSTELIKILNTSIKIGLKLIQLLETILKEQKIKTKNFLTKNSIKYFKCGNDDNTKLLQIK
jgi:exosome complex component RRP42